MIDAEGGDDVGTTRRSIRGPSVWENWQALLQGDQQRNTYEFALFSDSRFVGDTPPFGPYRFLNPAHQPRGQVLMEPALIGRVTEYGEFHFPAFTKTDVSAFHGGDTPDGLAALLSLLLGVRLKAGGVSRFFALNGDPAGEPTAWNSNRIPMPLLAPEPRILPRIPLEADLAETSLLAEYPLLTAAQAVVLLRAARLYQDALWLAESEPNLAWLMLVSSVETAANQWRQESGSAPERLRAGNPELAALLEDRGGDELVGKVSALISDSLGSTKKFIEFVLNYLPSPPPARPVEHYRSDWDPQAMKRHLRTIYQYRSRALHGGTPFPAPMCMPARSDPNLGGLLEISLGNAMFTQGGVWTKKDLPFLLHVFEYISRGVLLSWWRGLTAQPEPEDEHQ